MVLDYFKGAEDTGTFGGNVVDFWFSCGKWTLNLLMVFQPGYQHEMKVPPQRRCIALLN